MIARGTHSREGEGIERASMRIDEACCRRQGGVGRWAGMLGKKSGDVGTVG